MDQNLRSNLIGALADSFNAPTSDLTIETSNYISDTGAMDCTAKGLPLDALEKTKRVIEQHEAKFGSKTDDPMSSQYLAHLKVARKCVEEIILQKKRGR